MHVAVTAVTPVTSSLPSGVPAKSWTGWPPGEDEILKRAYEDDTVESAAEAAAAQLSHRSINAICHRASIKGWAETRRIRRAAAGLSTRPPREKRVVAVSAVAPLALPTAAAAAAPPAVAVAPPVRFPDATSPKPLVRPGPCDRGDREAIRRRILNVIATAIGSLAHELGRTPAEISRTLDDIAKGDFEPEPAFGGVVDLTSHVRTFRPAAVFRGMTACG